MRAYIYAFNLVRNFLSDISLYVSCYVVFYTILY